AEALLGQTLFTGREGVRPQRALGLMWLTLAREAAIDSKKDKWIIDLYDQAVASANDGDRQDALAFLEDHLKRRNYPRLWSASGFWRSEFWSRGKAIPC